jgi:hypothetical protein
MTSWLRTDVSTAGDTHKTDVDTVRNACRPPALTLSLKSRDLRHVPVNSSAVKLHQVPVCGEAAVAPQAAETLYTQATSTRCQPIRWSSPVGWGAVCGLTKAGGSPLLTIRTTLG